MRQRRLGEVLGNFGDTQASAAFVFLQRELRGSRISSHFIYAVPYNTQKALHRPPRPLRLCERPVRRASVVLNPELAEPVEGFRTLSLSKGSRHAIDRRNKAGGLLYVRLKNSKRCQSNYPCFYCMRDENRLECVHGTKS